MTFAGILQSKNIPVSLVVTIDPARASPKVPLNVERYINIFLSDSVLGGGDVVAKQGYRGHYASFDLKEHEEVTHINIDKMDSIHEQSVTAVAQLATTPVQTSGETLPLRYVVPPMLQSSCGTAARRNWPVRRYVAEACVAQPRAALVTHPGQSVVGQCTSDGWPARHRSAPPRATCRTVRSVAAETVTYGVFFTWSAGTESASERDGNTIRMHLRRVQP